MHAKSFIFWFLRYSLEETKKRKKETRSLVVQQIEAVFPRERNISKARSGEQVRQFYN